MTGEIVHYGVKGMHWGVHKKVHDDSPHPTYTKQKQANDARQFGKGGVKRINRKLNAGKTREQAHKSEHRRNTYRGAAAIGAVFAYNAIKIYGPVAMQEIAIKAETNRGKAAAAQALKNARVKNVKKNRKGVYNISSL